MTLRALLIAASAAALVACGAASDAPVSEADVPDVSETPPAPVAMAFDADRLASVLDAQTDAAKARFDDRNPAATLEFFEIAPGMAVGEALPGNGGWYTKILLPYLGDEGRLVAVDYDIDLWPNFDFGTEEFIEGKRSWPTTWTASARGWTDTDVAIDAYTFDTLPQDGSLDTFLFIRALHNMNRFEDGRFLDSGLAAVYGALKPGGTVGVVQHEGPADSDDAWANGSNGYLRKADVIASFEAAGFMLVGESDMNANPADMPTSEDSVWRLPPSLSTSREDETLRAEMQAIGETNRMTLRFRKPG